MKRILLPVILFANMAFSQTSEFETKAKSFIASKSKELNISSAHDFKLVHTRKIGDTEVLRFQQMLNGVPVFHAEIIVNLNSIGEVVYYTNSYKKDIQNIDVTPSITQQDAKLKSNIALKSTGEITFQEVGLFVDDFGQSTKLAYKVSTQIDDLPGDWEVFVDAKTGEVLSVKDVSVYHNENDVTEKKSKDVNVPFFKAPLAYVSGTGMVFNPDPLSAAHVAYAGNYVDNNDATNAELDAARTSVVLPEIDLTGGVYRLKSSYLDILDFENPKKGLFTQATSAFNFTRDNDAFEAVNSFYHMDKSLRYIDQTLGVICVPQQNGGDLMYDPSGLNGQDNSHFIPSSDRIAFGEGCVDDAEDADVVLHELGHGLHDWMTNGNANSGEGLGEGSGDYWAQSYSRSLNQWTSAEAAYHYMFSWDGHNACWGGRTTNYGAVYPGGLTGTIHTDGQIWATALMKIYDVIGRAKMDKAFLQGLALTGSTTTQAQAALAVRQAAINMNYPCADIKTMTTIFNATGYALPAVPLSINCPGNQTVVAGAGNTYTLPSYMSLTNAINPNCDATVTQNPVQGTVVAPGVYTVTMTATSGSSVNCNFTLTVQPSLSVDEYVKKNLKLYPNPASTEITISGDFISGQDIEIYNLLGQKLIQKNLETNEEKVDISSLSSGVYTAKFKGSNTTLKFIKN